MRVDTTRLGLACELVRLLRRSTNAWPTHLVWSGHDAAWRAMVGPHQGHGLTIRVCHPDEPYGDDYAVVELLHLPNTPPDSDSIWAYWNARFMRLDVAADSLDIADDSAVVELVQRLIADPNPPATTPPPAPAVVVGFTHARCLLCDRTMSVATYPIHMGMAHAIDTAALRFAGYEGDTYEFNDARGRAVGWLWTEEATVETA
jgi:hypothetical protein